MGGVEQERLGIPLFRPYKKLISITIRGRKFQVPENQMLLRAFQYLCPETIPYGRYCWNEECQYCRVSVKRPGGEQIGQALSCKLMAEDGLEVLELSAELTWNLLALLRPAPEPTPPEQG
jgi:2Fe-2S iron-sulfur cluster protein